MSADTEMFETLEENEYSKLTKEASGLPRAFPAELLEDFESEVAGRQDFGDDRREILLALLLGAHKARKQAILAVAARKKMLGNIDGTDRRSAAYLEAFDNSQNAERLRDEVFSQLWEACEKFTRGDADEV